MKNKFLLCLLLLYGQFSFAHYKLSNYFYSNGSNYDIVYHRISISVNPSVSAAISSGSVTTYFRTTVNNVNSLQFDLDGALTVSSAIYHGSSVTKSHSAATAILTITIPVIAAAGTLDSITINYSGTPPAPTTSIPSGYNYQLHNSKYAIYTLGEAFTAHTWWPCKESLYDKIDSVDLIVTAPNTYKVAGNGIVTEVASGSNVITTWKTRYPIATYGINFGIANYQNYQYTISTGGRNLNIMNYFYAEDYASYKGYADSLKSDIPVYVSVLNVDYPFLNEKYGLAECTGGWGALEVQSMTFMSTSSYTDNGYTIAHEMAHQWFGDMITTNSWHQIWLNEGFAQYFQSVIYPEHVRKADLPTQRSNLKKAVTTSSTVYVPDTTSVDKIFIPSNTVAQPYEKGAMVLSMLRAWMGDAAFFQALHNYLSSPTLQYNFTAVDSLRKYMQAQTPLSLTNFFSDWVNKKGYASYNVQWASPTKKVVIQLQQSSTFSGAGYFDMPVPIRIQGPGLDTTVIIIDSRGVLYNNVTGTTSGTNKITFNLSATPTSISFDPDNLVLATSSSISVNQVLPLTFMNFRAIKENNEVRLGWTILQDKELRSLLIEKSIDGKHFTELTEVKNFTEDEKRISGSYNDELKASVQYYRLELKRKDNVSEYSSIEKVEENLSIKYKLTPNPANDYISLKLPNNLEEKPLRIIVQSSSGSVIKVIPINNSSKLSIDVKDLSNGIYYARLESDQKDLFCASFIKF